MPLITFNIPIHTVDDYMAVIRQTITGERPVSMQAGPESIEWVDLPDATQLEADTVEAALRANFPKECVKGEVPVCVPLIMTRANIQWLNMPAAVTEFLGTTTDRTMYSLANFRQARLMVQQMVAGAVAAELGLQGSTNGGTTWYSFPGVLNSAGPIISIGGANGYNLSPWVDISDAITKDVLIRIVGRNGDGAIDPSFRNIMLHLR
jgi:hypothetical protein